MDARKTWQTDKITCDVCVVGGGMAGVCAAISAARHGAQVTLVHDRTVLGGNASSECRIHICGADRTGTVPNVRETGILEELRLENVRRNRQGSHPLWDLLVYERVMSEEGITLLLNCTCQEAAMDGGQVASVTCWQTTTQRYFEVSARAFIDCSGDGVLAPMTGASFRMGREGRDEYGESIAPEVADSKTMGMTCLFSVREHDSPQPFEKPDWANVYDDEDLPCLTALHSWWKMGFWWVELGGNCDSIRDAEDLRFELLKIAMGVWDHIKNRGEHGAENYALDWIGFLPAKRESRRYVGAHVLTQGDIESCGEFADVVAYGGWPMDDHHPAGFHAHKLGFPATVFYEAPTPFGLPFGMLYSHEINNLMFAGRCASATHAAMSSTRVMGTGSVMGQAVGTAAAMAVQKNCLPKDISASYISELQQKLLRDDCYLPGLSRSIPQLTKQASIESTNGDAEALRDGVERPVGDECHAWECAPGDSISYQFLRPARVSEVQIVFDSALDRKIALTHLEPSLDSFAGVPDVMCREYTLEALVDGKWLAVHTYKDNHQRNVAVGLDCVAEGVRLTIVATWGAQKTRVYGFYCTGS